MRTATILAACAVAAALVAAVALTFVDTYTGQSCEVTSGGPTVCTDESSTLIEENGRGVIVLLAVPVVLSAGMLAATVYRLPRALEWLLAGGLLAGCLVAIASIGFFFLPAAALLIAAAASERREAAQA